MKKFILVCLFAVTFATNTWLQASAELKGVYEQNFQTPSDINEHLPHLRRLASECSSVAELGLRTMVSSWGILQGLSESPFVSRSYLGVDIALPPTDMLNLAQSLARGDGISFEFWHANDMDVEIPLVDMLFIDTLHTYCHLTYELEKFSPKVLKYIAMHDTADPYGWVDDYSYHGNRSEYPSYINRRKRGLLNAVQDFLGRHPEWVLFEQYQNNHGFTVLKRREN